MRETFLPELEAQGPPASLEELNRRAGVWLDANVHAVESRSTGARPAERHGIERPFLSALPTQRFDTDYVQARRVHNILPFVAIDGVRYSVPPQTLGQLVEVRRPVGAQRFEVVGPGGSSRPTALSRAAASTCGTPPTATQRRPRRWRTGPRGLCCA